jgi:hypothetical protein
MEVVKDSRGRKRRRKPEADLPPQFHVRGNLLEFRNGKAWYPPPAHAKRERISQFSPAARLRLIKELQGIDYRKTPMSVAVTLTYPDQLLPRAMEQRRMDRSQFLRHVEAHQQKPVYGIWRTEWLPRKTGRCVGMIAPHIHLVLFGVRFIPYDVVNEWWKGCIQWRDYVRTEIKRARKQRTTLHYLSKYITKTVDSSLVYPSYLNNPDGKHYDWIRRELIPMYPHEWIPLTDPEQDESGYNAHKRAWPESETMPGESYSIIGTAAKIAAKIIKQIALTPRAAIG